MRNVARNHQDFAFTDDVFDYSSVLAKQEAKGSLRDVGDLFVGMLVAWDDAAFLKFNARKHGLRPGHKLTGQQGIELRGGNVGPAGMKQFFGHLQRVPHRWSEGIGG